MWPVLGQSPAPCFWETKTVYENGDFTFPDKRWAQPLHGPEPHADRRVIFGEENAFYGKMSVKVTLVGEGLSSRCATCPACFSPDKKMETTQPDTAAQPPQPACDSASCPRRPACFLCCCHSQISAPTGPELVGCCRLPVSRTLFSAPLCPIIFHSSSLI